jgi:acetyltransferase-like isoleucine patch superfamily enzyme
MFRLVARIREKLARTWFTIRFKGSFRHLGDGCYVVAPFRIDGGDRIELDIGTFIQRGSWLYCGEIDEHLPVLKVGKHCVFGYNNHITCVRSVEIGDFVLTANNVYISDNVHGYEDISRPIIQQPVVFKGGVAIGSGSWIGENVSIIGARIGRNCVIGANSVVTHDVPDYCVAVGVPAKVIRQYDPNSCSWVRTSADAC